MQFIPKIIVILKTNMSITTLILTDTHEKTIILLSPFLHIALCRNGSGIGGIQNLRAEKEKHVPQRMD